MELFKKLQKLMAMPLIILMVLSTFTATTVQARMVGTDTIITQESASADRAKLMEFIERDEVRAEMEALGVDPDEAMSRVQSLSDEEVQRVAGQLETMPAGEGALGAIVGGIVLVFLVLLLTDLLCLTNVFDFTRCAR